MATVDVAGGYFHSTIRAIRSVTIPARRTCGVNPVWQKRAVGPVTLNDNNSTDLSVICVGPCCPCHMTLLKEYYRVAMSLCRYTISVVAVSYYVWTFYVCFLKGAFSLFSSVAFLLRSLVPSVVLMDISDQIRSVVSFGGRGARLWRHPG